MAHDDLIQDCSSDMEKAIEAHRLRLNQIRTGRASLSLLDPIRVEYYGNLTPLNQVATMAAPEPRLITISPWEKSMLGAIEKAIQKSDLGLNPQNDGKIIRIPIPELTADGRKGLIKQVGKESENSRVAIRNVRRDYMDMVKLLEKDKEISEDESHRLQGRIQEVTDKLIARVDELSAVKEREITEV